MTGISERKFQWESEAIEAERKMIAEWVASNSSQAFDDFDDGWNNACDFIARKIERGEYRKTEAGE